MSNEKNLSESTSARIDNNGWVRLTDRHSLSEENKTFILSAEEIEELRNFLIEEDRRKYGFSSGTSWYKELSDKVKAESDDGALKIHGSLHLTVGETESLRAFLNGLPLQDEQMALIDAGIQKRFELLEEKMKAMGFEISHDTFFGVYYLHLAQSPHSAEGETLEMALLAFVEQLLREMHAPEPEER